MVLETNVVQQSPLDITKNFGWQNRSKIDLSVSIGRMTEISLHDVVIGLQMVLRPSSVPMNGSIGSELPR